MVIVNVVTISSTSRISGTCPGARLDAFSHTYIYIYDAETDFARSENIALTKQ
jgi:hypothetical protein